jgi:2-polyprenyl-3-methyl-5-hydroxy-6-metoxy-1,4-benzoquinol methylase
MENTDFDTEGVFDEDYLHFYGDLLDEDRNDGDADLIWRLLDLEPGMRVLDLACGHGRIANRLAARGVEVTGLDVTPLFLELARRDAAERGVHVEYVQGDMRDLPWHGRFDRVVCWFTAFGYFDDPGNKLVLRQMAGALVPGGRALIDLNNRDWILRAFVPDRVYEHGDDLMIDRSELRMATNTIHTERIIVRGGKVRRTRYSVRLFTYTELRDWVLEAGFREVHGYGEAGTELSIGSRRLAVVAER